ncbi:MAG: 3-phosphoshikimate 1-carboxyvinyltransferase, partial [Thermoanaerobaculia bacterium]
RLTGVARLTGKESDRLATALDLLARAGAVARVGESGGGSPCLVIDGARGTPQAAAFAAHGDHRVAMSAAVLALVLPGSSLDDSSCVAKSWPGFWEAWNPLVL